MASTETPDVEIPVQHLFSMTLTNLRADRFDFVGPFGRRIFERPTGGEVSGERVKGKVLNLLATDYGGASPDGSIRQFEAYVTAQTEDGVIILMQIRGRSSPRYGPGQSRIQLLFTVGKGPYDWLNGIQAIGIGHEQGADGIYEIYGLTREPEWTAEGLAPTQDPAARTSVRAEYLFTRQSQRTPNADRHMIDSPIFKRFLTLAEGGGAFEGPRIRGEFLSGFSWSPHYVGSMNDEPLLHYDVKTLLRTDDGTPVLMSYVGVFSPMGADRSWATATLFETAAGPHAWLNEIQAVGIGRTVGDGAQYKVYGLR